MNSFCEKVGLGVVILAVLGSMVGIAIFVGKRVARRHSQNNSGGKPPTRLTENETYSHTIKTIITKIHPDKTRTEKTVFVQETATVPENALAAALVKLICRIVFKK